MRLNFAQRWIVFILFCLFVITCGVFEIYLGYAVVEKGFSNGGALLGLLNGGVLLGCGRLFLQMTARAFLKPSITSERLHRFAADRCSVIDDPSFLGNGEYQGRQNLVRNTLKFAEKCLNGWVPGSHLEFCVFVDQEQPLMFAYFDSNGDLTARSMNTREQNPSLYVQQGYEVTKLLQAPTSQPQFLKDTEALAVKYFFASNHQRKQVRSSILLCLDVGSPCALVISSNKKNAFPETDAELVSFVKYVGALVRCDLFEDNFIHRIRTIRPELFM